jgi:aryl-alcohol dehydrogenase-like predicted oxidoreductase
MMADNRDFHLRVPLGKTGMQVGRIGLAASYGIDGKSVEEAYGDYGINFLYWGSARRKSFGEGIRQVAQKNREDIVVVIQSYSRLAGWLGRSLERGLRELKLEYADILLLGMFNRFPSPKILETAQRLKSQGKTRFLAVSCHRRSTFQRYISDGNMDVIMLRYNAAHRGAETEIFPFIPDTNRQGTIAYTATRWGSLISPKKMPKDEAIPRASDCYRFVLSQPLIDVCLAGPANRDQLTEALTALNRGPMNDDELAWMRRIGDHIHAKALMRG